jgi:hypothetical protein
LGKSWHKPVYAGASQRKLALAGGICIIQINLLLKNQLQRKFNKPAHAGASQCKPAQYLAGPGYVLSLE